MFHLWPTLAALPASRRRALRLLGALGFGVATTLSSAPATAQSPATSTTSTAPEGSRQLGEDGEPHVAFTSGGLELEAEIVDADQHPARGTKGTVLLVGTVFTLGFYGTALGSSYLWEDDPGAADLRIPVAGPWMKVGQTTLCKNLPNETGNCSDVMQVMGAVLAAFNGLGQVAGLALLTEGIFMKQASGKAVRSAKYGYRGPYATRPRSDQGVFTFQSGSVTMTPVPFGNGRDSLGLGLFGRF